MISVYHIPDTNIVELQIDGAITAEAFEKATAEIESLIKQYGKLKVLKRIDKLTMPPIPWAKFWDDLRFGMKHFRDFTHAAIVSDHDWVRAWAKAWNPLLKMEIKTFKADEMQAARAWLSHADVPAEV